MDIKLEICCGSYEDCLRAEAGGASRVELNSALYMGGLTPSMATLKQVKAETEVEVITMVRPRAAGFCYSREEFENMLMDAELFLQQGADGIAFGFLQEDGSIDEAETKQMVQLIHQYHGQAVFHRAFDCVKDPVHAIEYLIAIGVDRILTSGCAPTAPQGKEVLSKLQKNYGNDIEILAGCGVNAKNVLELINDTDVKQVHSSCKDWRQDPTTIGPQVSYAYGQGDNASCYDIVALDKVKELVGILKKN